MQRWQANWELVIKLFRNIPRKDEEEMTNKFHIFELQNENINAEKIIAVKYSTYATARNEAGDGKLYLCGRISILVLKFALVFHRDLLLQLPACHVK